MIRAAAWLCAHSRTQRSCSPAASANSAVVAGRPSSASAVYSPSRSPRWIIPAVTAPLSWVNTPNENIFRRSGSISVRAASVSVMATTVILRPVSACAGRSACALLGGEVLDVAELREAEVKPSWSSSASSRLIDVWPITKRSHSHGVGWQPEQVRRSTPSSCRRGRRARSSTRVRRSARSAVVRRTAASPLGEELVGAGADPLGELADRLATVEALPPLVDRRARELIVGRLRLLLRCPVPRRVADLLEPRRDLLVTAERLEQRRGGLAGPKQRRRVHLVEVLAGQRLRPSPAPAAWPSSVSGGFSTLRPSRIHSGWP